MNLKKEKLAICPLWITLSIRSAELCSVLVSYPQLVKGAHPMSVQCTSIFIPDKVNHYQSKKWMWARGEKNEGGISNYTNRKNIYNKWPAFLESWFLLHWALIKALTQAKTLGTLDICLYLYFNAQAFCEDKTQGSFRPVIIRATIY